MSATSPRRLRRDRRRPTLEPLETRTLLTAQPTAVADAYTAFQGQTLSVSFPRNYIHAGTNALGPAPYTWTTADGPIAAWRIGTGSVSLQVSTEVSPWALELTTTTQQPLQPGSYVAGRPGDPGIQGVVYWLYGGISVSDQLGTFTVQHFDAASDDAVTRLDADFTIDGVVAGTVHYSAGPRGVLDNDGGPVDGVTASLVTGPAHGSLSLNADGTFSYTPDPGFAGTDSFAYAASDGTTTSAPAAVTLNVLPANAPPSFTKGADITLAEDAGPQSIDNWATNISTGPYAFDAGQSVSFLVFVNSSPTLFSQTPSIDPTGRLTFTSAPDATGTATITVLLRDSGGTANGGENTSALQTLTISVTPVDDAPVAHDSSVSTDVGQPISGHVSSSDVDGPDIFAYVVTRPANGSLTFRPTGDFTYTPAAGFVGTDSFQFAVADGTLSSAPATVTVAVQPPPTVQFTGRLFDVYPQANGAGLTPLAARPVFDDANGNGLPDTGEAVAYTNTAGVYTLSLPAGPHTIRPVPKPGWLTPAGYPDSVTVDSSAPAGQDLYTTMADPVVIDVLAVHPDSLSTLATGLPWDAAILNAFRVANYIFANSDTNVRLRLLSIRTVSYTPSSTSLDADLSHLISPRDGVLDTVPKLRDSLKADLAILFDARPDAAGNYGVAKLLNPAHLDGSLGYAVVVATDSEDATGTVLAHEIGHTLGADHDPQNHPLTTLPYAHGYRFAAGDGTVYRDVMAYAPGTQLPFFSTPHITYRGHALGDAATADTARVVRGNAYVVAGYRGAAVFPPSALPATAVATTKVPAKPGAAVAATVKVRNNFVSKFSGNISVAYYLSADRTLDASDTLLARKTVSAKNVRPKSTFSTSATVKVPATTGTGTYYLLAVATAAGQPADPHAAPGTAAAAALKVAVPPKKKVKTAQASAAARFQSARPIGEPLPRPERTSGDADEVITGMLLSPPPR